MIDEVAELIDQHLTWLRDRTRLRSIGDSVEITTPYLDRHNDCLQIYTTRDRAGFVLSDDGYVLEDLELSGLNIDSAKCQASLKTILNGFGVQQKGTALQVNASADNFSLSKHNLVQAMLAANDLSCLASHSDTSRFHREVATWLYQSDVRYSPDVEFIGKSGFNHRIDFVIPKSDAQPERAVIAMDLPSRNAVQALAFSWIDVKDGRSADTQAYVILNDSNKNISQDVERALLIYEVRLVRWTERDDILEEFAS